MDKEIKELEKALEQIWDIAIKFGLDPFPTHFEIVPSEIMYEIGSYALPGRYSHWTFGKAYHRMKLMYDLGLSRIYEVVINTNPAYGFLLDTNSLLQNKLVMAHVLGHVDFFKNNFYFSKTNRRMINEVSVHSDRIDEYEFKHGRKTVEEFLDAVLSIEEHIDPDFFVKKKQNPTEITTKFSTDPFYDLLTQQEQKPSKETPQKTISENTPVLPEKDLVWFIAKYSPILEPWQRDLMEIIHDEMLYFVPQMQTKICNEGWASFWHARIMRELELSNDEYLEFAKLHSGVVCPHKGQLNPYYLGYKILEDIEKRWNNPSLEEREKSGRKGGEGQQKLLEVREVENDISLLRNYLTEELCEELDLYVFELAENKEWKITDKKWEHIRDQLVASKTNFGFPYIEITDADYDGNRELYLTHRFEGVELDIKYATKVIEYVYKLWGRKIHLETQVDDNAFVLHYDGKSHSEN